MPFSTAPTNQARELNIQLLDTAKISNWHQWDTLAQRDISFRHNVPENMNPRADTARYKLIDDLNHEAACAAFSRACSSTTLFKIPPSIKCDRTFARDAYEAYYLDAMHQYLQKPPEELQTEDIPLLKGPLHSRYFSAFARKPIYFNELFERRRLGHWVPCDSPDLDFFSDLEKAAWFPKMEAWIRQIFQPSALPVPVPPVLY